MDLVRGPEPADLVARSMQPVVAELLADDQQCEAPPGIERNGERAVLIGEQQDWRCERYRHEQQELAADEVQGRHAERTPVVVSAPAHEHPPFDRRSRDDDGNSEEGEDSEGKHGRGHRRLR